MYYGYSYCTQYPCINSITCINKNGYVQDTAGKKNTKPLQLHLDFFFFPLKRNGNGALATFFFFSIHLGLSAVLTDETSEGSVRLVTPLSGKERRLPAHGAALPSL